MMTIERENLTAIPHAKCTCGHADDMHYASAAERDEYNKQNKGKPQGLIDMNRGWGCKMSVHDHGDRGRVNASKPCSCRRWQPAR